jgi:hypothetical protein
MQDWLQDHNDPDGNLAVQRDTALYHLDPVFEERKRLIVEVVRTLTELRKTPTNKFLRNSGLDLRRGFGSLPEREELHDNQ